MLLHGCLKTESISICACGKVYLREGACPICHELVECKRFRKVKKTSKSSRKALGTVSHKR